MKTKIVITDNFEKEAKRFLKKYKSLKSELNILYTELTTNPRTGTSLGKNARKIRLKVKSKGKGKRGGLRLITYLEVDAFLDENLNILYLLTIYDKSETEAISEKEIMRIISKLKSE
jgi:mRNA-degrading endonuclease RelE of RelBE toxin-antitoxin system